MSVNRERRTLPIRKWLALALISLIVLPVCITGGVAFHLLGIGNDEQSQAIAKIGNDAARWHDPVWQETTRTSLHEKGIDFVLVSNGKVIYQSNPRPLDNNSGRLVRKISMSSDNAEQYFIIYSSPNDGWHTNFWVLPLVGLSTLLLTLSGIAWFLGRALVRPLAATGAAARSIASGNLEFDIPTSRVKEVADVNDAFAAMSEALRDSLSEQAAVEQERRIFISTIVHDLRTPVFSLRGYLEGLQTGVADTTQKRQKYIEIAQEKAAALERLITDLFDFTRLEYLEQVPNCDVMNFGQLLTRLSDSMRPQADAKNVLITVTPLPENTEVLGDSHLLSRAIENLLVNAIRYTPNGGRIWVDCLVEPRTIRFSVFDTGSGVAEEDLPRIFNPLFRGEQSRNRRTGGVGLGLTIARRIIQAHDGTLTAANHRAGGAVFSGTLPRAYT